MNMISINFQNIVTIGLITYLGAMVKSFVEAKTGVDVDMDGEVDTFEANTLKSVGKGRRKK